MMVDYSELKASQLKQLLQGMDKSSANVDLPANVQLSIPIKSFAANNIRCGADATTDHHLVRVPLGTKNQPQMLICHQYPNHLRG
jgi:hypothetical protein